MARTERHIEGKVKGIYSAPYTEDLKGLLKEARKRKLNRPEYRFEEEKHNALQAFEKTIIDHEDRD